jgi:small subunit ribosomal protein S16
MVVIRLARGGAKGRPFYHLMVTDKRSARDGRYVERIGYFNPIATGGEVKLHIEPSRLQYWLDNGAQPSERVEKLIKEFNQAQAAA